MLFIRRGNGDVFTEQVWFLFLKEGTLLIAIDMKWSRRKRASVSVQEPITAETSTESPSSWEKEKETFEDHG